MVGWGGSAVRCCEEGGGFVGVCGIPWWMRDARSALGCVWGLARGRAFVKGVRKGCGRGCGFGAGGIVGDS